MICNYLEISKKELVGKYTHSSSIVGKCARLYTSGNSKWNFYFINFSLIAKTPYLFSSFGE